MHRSESCRSLEALHNEQLARSAIESSLCSSADMISQIGSRLQTADDQHSEERRVISILANRLLSTEQVALQTSHELTSRHDIISTRYVLISWGFVCAVCILSVK